MRELSVADLGPELRDLLSEANPADEDIGILDNNGQLAAVIITPDAYRFFLKKVEEEEDRLDIDAVEKFDGSGEKDL